MFYTDWLKVTRYGVGIDAYTAVEVKDESGNWSVAKRFYEMDDFMTSKRIAFINHLLNNHAATH